MSNTENPSKPTVKNESSVTEQGEPKEEYGGPEPRKEAVVESLPGPNGNGGSTEETKGPHKWLKAVWATLPLLISVAALIISFDSRNASWQSASAATRSAAAAGKSADAAAAATRAWISFWQGKFTEVKDSRVYFNIALQNAGSTPATSITITWKVTFVPGPDIHAVQKPEYASCPSENVTILGVIGTKEAWEIVVPSDPLGEVEQKMLAEKTAHLFIYGCARYRDVLVPKEERLTEIGLIYPSVRGEAGFTLDPRYNRMR